MEQSVWEAVAAILRDPSVLFAKINARREILDQRRSAVQSEVDELERQLGRLRKQAERLLQAYLDEQIAQSVYGAKASELRHHEEALASRIADIKATTTSDAIDVQRQDAVLAYCELARRGLDRLDAAGRQRLLGLLIDRIVVHDRRLEIEGVLPTDGAPLPTSPDGENVPPIIKRSARNRPQSPDIVVGYAPLFFKLEIPVGSPASA